MEFRTDKGNVMADRSKDFSDLAALFINTTLTRSPGISHTQLLIDVSADIMINRASPLTSSGPSTTGSRPASTLTCANAGGM